MTAGVIRTYASIRATLDGADLPAEALACVTGCSALRGGRGEASTADLESVTFHEADAVDTLVEVVGTALALTMLGVERVFASAVPTGLGMARTEHGAMPIPSPTVVEPSEGAPYSRGVTAELTNAAGAAILAATAEGYGELPAIRVETAGYGAGEARARLERHARGGARLVAFPDRAGTPTRLVPELVSRTGGDGTPAASVASDRAGDPRAPPGPRTRSAGPGRTTATPGRSRGRPIEAAGSSRFRAPRNLGTPRASEHLVPPKEVRMRNHRRAGLLARPSSSCSLRLSPLSAHRNEGQGETERSPLSGAPAASRPRPSQAGNPVRSRCSRPPVDAWTLQGLVNQGYDVTPVEDTLDGIVVALVLSPRRAALLEAKGVELTLQECPKEREARAAAASQSIFGFDVFRPYDEPGGIEDQPRRSAPTPCTRASSAKLYDIGDTVEGRDILAIRTCKVLADARSAVVLRSCTRGPRMRGSGSAPRRRCGYTERFLAERRAKNPDVVEIWRSSELWFIPVVNPDGYEFTFTDERLCARTPRQRRQRYHQQRRRRGPRTGTTPTTGAGKTTGRLGAVQRDVSAMPGLGARDPGQHELHREPGRLQVHISYHSFAQLLLHTQGGQTPTPSADDPIYVALSGDRRGSRDRDFNPGVGADLVHDQRGVHRLGPRRRGGPDADPRAPPEGCEDEPGCNNEFEFDDEAKVQVEFERNLAFALNLARSCGDSRRPDIPHGPRHPPGLYVNVGGDRPVEVELAELGPSCPDLARGRKQPTRRGLGQARCEA